MTKPTAGRRTSHLTAGTVLAVRPAMGPGVWHMSHGARCLACHGDKCANHGARCGWGKEPALEKAKRPQQRAAGAFMES